MSPSPVTEVHKLLNRSGLQPNSPTDFDESAILRDSEAIEGQRYGAPSGLVLTVVIATALHHVIVGVLHGGPVAVPDVSAYLSVSQWVHGGVLPSPLPFFPAYGLLLSPFGFLSGASLHSVALGFNGLCAAASIWCVHCITKRVKVRRPESIALVGITALHPSLSGASRIAWPETVLTLLVLLVGLLVVKHSFRSWIGAGLLVGFSLSLHPRASVLVIALLVVGLTVSRIFPAALGATIGTGFSSVLVGLTDTWPTMRVEALSGFPGASNIAATTGGQILAVAGGTAGIGLVGLAAGLLGFWKPSAPIASSMFFSISAIGVLLLGGWTLAGSARIDTLLYGRYIDPWSVPLLISGVTFASSFRSRRGTRLVLLLLIFAATMTLISNASQVHSSGRRIMTMSLGLLWEVAGNELILVGVCAAILSVFGVLLFDRFIWLPLSMCLLFAASSTITNHLHLHEVGRVSDGQVTVASEVPKNFSCLAHDDSMKSYALWLYRLELPNVHHRRVDLSRGGTPCSSLVLAGKEVMEECRNAVLIGNEKRATWGLWRYPLDGCD